MSSDDTIVPQEEVNAQSQLLVDLLQKEGCIVKILKDRPFSATAITRVYNEEECVFSVEHVGYAAYNIGLKKGLEDGFHELLFNGAAVYFLRKNGYVFKEHFCRAYNYPYYRKIDEWSSKGK